MKNNQNMPDLVYFALIGINSRLMAYAFFVTCLVISLACLYYGFKQPLFFYGVVMLLPAAWYYYAIRWVDKHASWDQ